MSRLLRYGVCVMCIVMLFGLFFEFTSYQTVDAQANRPAVVQVTGHLHGQAVEKRTVQLTRFQTPITTIPHVQPTPINGFRWHWHPHHGWVSLPVGTAAEVLLPQTFVLPASVTVYEATTTQTQLICPHCGQPILIQAR